MPIPLNTAGDVIGSKHRNHKIKVVDDSESTGGFLIYEWWDGSDGPNSNHAFDSWVETLADAQQFIVEAKYRVAWHT